MQLHSLLKLIVPDTMVTLIIDNTKKEFVTPKSLMDDFPSLMGNSVERIYDYNTSYAIEIGLKRNNTKEENITVSDIVKAMYKNFYGSELELVNKNLEIIHYGAVRPNAFSNHIFDVEKYSDYNVIMTCIEKNGVSAMIEEKQHEQS